MILGGIGDDRTLASDKEPLRKGAFVGGKMGEFMFDEGADEPTGWADVMARNLYNLVGTGQNTLATNNVSEGNNRQSCPGQKNQFRGSIRKTRDHDKP